MKPFAVVALNVVTIAVALVAYDVLRSDGEPPEAAPEIDASRIEARLDALESEPRRARRAPTAEPDILRRLAALEAVRGSVSPTVAVEPVGEGEPAAAGAFDEGPGDEPPRRPADAQPSDDEIARFRRVAAAVRAEDMARKNAKRINRVLDALPVNLTEEQRQGVHTRWASFQPRVNEIWTQVKQEAQATVKAGGSVDRETIVTDTHAVISDEFAGLLGGLINPADSETIADALAAGGK